MLKFLKDTIFNGLLIVLPLLFLIIIIKEFVELLIGLATPIADLFPPDLIENIPETEILAAVLIVLASLLIGICALLPPLASLGQWFEDKVLDKIPVYRPLKTLLHALLGSEQSEAFKPAFLMHEDDVLEPVYIVEDTGRPRVVVLVPWTPASFAGSMRIVPRDRVHPVDLSFDEFSLSIAHFGVGMMETLSDVPEGLAIKRETGDQD